jgi:hypothetical protein
MEVELLLQALRNSAWLLMTAALVITSSRYFIKDVSQMTWMMVINACFME